MRELFTQWVVQHPETNRKMALGTLKGQAASLRAKRRKTKDWAEAMVPIVDEARVELGNDVGPTRLAEWLNDRKVTTSSGGRFHGPNIGAHLYGVDRLIARDAVMECRTKMSALALSANFEVSDTGAAPLEAECIEKIMAAMLLARRLERRAVITGADLRRGAIAMAAEEARTQREGYFPMLARECYLSDAEFDEVVPSIERLYSVAMEDHREGK